MSLAITFLPIHLYHLTRSRLMLMSILRDWHGEHLEEVPKEVRRRLTPKSESQNIDDCQKHTPLIICFGILDFDFMFLIL